MKRGTWWMMSWNIWSIPFGLGGIATVLDWFQFRNHLSDDFVCWSVTALCVFLAIGSLKGIIPVNTDNRIFAVWVAFWLATFTWSIHWLAPRLIHLHF